MSRAPTTLKLAVDSRGLKVAIDLPGTQLGRDTLTSVERGDLSQISFAFLTLEDDWRAVGTEIFRDVLDLKLIDVSVVAYPAYTPTKVAAARGALMPGKPREVDARHRPVPAAEVRARGLAAIASGKRFGWRSRTSPMSVQEARLRWLEVDMLTAPGVTPLQLAMAECDAAKRELKDLLWGEVPRPPQFGVTHPKARFSRGTGYTLPPAARTAKVARLARPRNGAGHACATAKLRPPGGASH